MELEKADVYLQGVGMDCNTLQTRSWPGGLIVCIHL